MSEDESVLERSAAPPDAVVAWGDGPDQVADVRHGGERAARRPLLAIVHGGFWRPRYDRTHTGPMAEALAAAGWHVASLEYRRIPGTPGASVADVATALAALPAMIGGHAGEVVAIGHSAGGHLVLLAATKPPPRLRGVLALAPVADLRLAQTLNLGDGAVAAFLGADAAARSDLDPRRLADPVVATAIVHGEEDETVPLAVAQSYLAAHAQVSLEALPGCGHYEVIDPLSRAWPRVAAAIERLGAG
ncbi:alpha/beta hydrolase [Dokdonella sp.]|uniref:alpha/beta hydrolase family protein n=1 Tax=Dokdonella sp. TaxID=2291710 RepID=UPI001B198A9B|nr:alpha/beta hydrolase [Dokdonella sp.]MBO9664128.1 alpha/beta hydrolase [Dokdonella sp.]